MTDQELKDLVASIAQTQAETAEQMKKTDAQLKETDRTIKRLGKQIGDLGNKFGSFTEGMAEASMRKILMGDLGMTSFSPRHLEALNGRHLELDVLSYDATTRREAYIVEVKSRLDNKGIQQVLDTLNEAQEFVPAIRGLKLYGIIAAVDIPSKEVRQEVFRQGLLLARIGDHTFKLDVPPEFKPKDFNKAATNGHPNGRPARKTKDKKR